MFWSVPPPTSLTLFLCSETRTWATWPSPNPIPIPLSYFVSTSSPTNSIAIVRLPLFCPSWSPFPVLLYFRLCVALPTYDPQLILPSPSSSALSVPAMPDYAHWRAPFDRPDVHYLPNGIAGLLWLPSASPYDYIVTTAALQEYQATALTTLDPPLPPPARLAIFAVLSPARNSLVADTHWCAVQDTDSFREMGQGTGIFRDDDPQDGPTEFKGGLQNLALLCNAILPLNVLLADSRGLLDTHYHVPSIALNHSFFKVSAASLGRLASLGTVLICYPLSHLTTS